MNVRAILAATCLAAISFGCTNGEKFDFEKSRESAVSCLQKHGFDNEKYVVTEDFNNLSESFYEECRSEPLTTESTIKVIEIYSQCRKYHYEEWARDIAPPLICQQNHKGVRDVGARVNLHTAHMKRMFSREKRMEKYWLPDDPESVARREKYERKKDLCNDAHRRYGKQLREGDFYSARQTMKYSIVPICDD